MPTMRSTFHRGVAAALGLCLAAGCSSTADRDDDPGRVTMHRLNRTEYDNTVRDLLGTALRPAQAFPAETDTLSYGFDTIADALRMSPLLLELYEGAAQALITDALATSTSSSTQDFEVVGDTTSGNAQGGGWLFFTSGTATINVNAPAAGTYHLRIRAYEQHLDPDPAHMSVTVVGQAPTPGFDVTALAADPQVYSVDVVLPAGSVQIAIGFTNDGFDQATMADRNLWVDYVQLEGPVDGPIVDGGMRGRIFVCDALPDRACQTQILTAFTGRAWRRPATQAELDGLLALVDTAILDGDTAEAGLRLALQAALISPHFLFRIEVDPDPSGRTPRPLTDWELASRLSYFLWSTMPDDALLAAAAAGRLSDPAQLEAEVTRMLDDPKADALVENFASLWLQTRAIASQTDPDYTLFPMWDDELEAAVVEETKRYFRAFLDDGVPMNEFLTARFTFVNDRLAEYYGLPPVGTDDFVRVSLEGTNRRGYLTQASFLRLTSHPKRTSPTKRGKWVLDNLLCAPPRPPPSDVNLGAIVDNGQGGGSLRDRLAEHRNNPLCASCHNAMDGMGLALENFDAVGQFRTMDGEFPIDSGGRLFGEFAFADRDGMIDQLASQPSVYRCMVEKLYLYSGRLPNRIEAQRHIDELTIDFVAGGYQLRDLLTRFVTHPSFTSRRGEP